MHVFVDLRGTANGFIMTIDDNGVGFDVDAAQHGLGLISMRERVEHVGGALTLRSQPGAGTHLEVSVPSAAVQTDAVRAS